MATPFTIDDIATYYANLLALQYRGQSRAYATIRILIKQAVFDYMAEQLQEGFNVDTAVGAQLDIIGKYVGVSRNINDIVDLPFFGFLEPDFTGNLNGMTDALTNVNTGVIFLDESQTSSATTSLDDVSYRFVIKLQIILNHSDLTLASAQNYINMFFPGLITVIDNQDMTLTYYISEDVPLSIGILKQFLPRPMGVGINVVKTEDRVLSDLTTLRVTSSGDTRVIDID